MIHQNVRRFPLKVPAADDSLPEVDYGIPNFRSIHGFVPKIGEEDHSGWDNGGPDVCFRPGRKRLRSRSETVAELSPFKDIECNKIGAGAPEAWLCPL